MDALNLIAGRPLDEKSRQPLYLQLKNRIEQLIATSALEEGDTLPPEETLCHELDLSRSTVRRCFKDLAEEGYVTRRRGRGTFVSGPEQAGRADNLYTQISTSRTIERSGAHASNRIIRIRALPAHQTIARRLSLEDGERVWEVNRLRLADGEPVLHELAYVPRDLCPNLGKADFGRSLYLHIAEASGVIVHTTEEVIDFVRLDSQEARLLHASKDSGGVRSIITSFDIDGKPFETSVGIARADRFHLLLNYAANGGSFRKVFSS